MIYGLLSWVLRVSSIDSVLRGEVQLSCKLQGLVVFLLTVVPYGRQMALLAPMLRHTLALYQLPHTFTVPFVQLEVVFHLCNLHARLQIEYSGGNFKVFSFYTLVFKLSCVEMQTF